MIAKELREMEIEKLLKTVDIAIRVIHNKIDEIEDKEDLKLFLIYLSKELLTILEELQKQELEEKAKL
jgi:galactitol-specific phosphotransferase system IIB component